MGLLIDPYRFALAGPTLISATVQAGSAQNFNVPIPGTAQDGDLLICAVGHAFAVNLPAGWTDRNNLTGSNTNGRTFSKVCSGDAGTNLAVTTSGSFAYSAVMFVVRSGTWRTMTAYRASSHSANVGIATGNATAVVADLALYFAHFRVATSTITFAHVGAYDAATTGNAGGSSGRSGSETVSATSWGNTFACASGGQGSYGVNIIIGP